MQYRVHLKDGLAIGTQIQNTASIYFDLNAPVATNTATNTLAAITTSIDNIVNETMVNVYPNPANSRLFISLAGFKPQLVAVWDMNGRKIMEQKFTSPVDISLLQAGIYIVELRNDGAVARKRFVKQ